ncbi:hypothetical protein ABZS88_36075 [Streptomyces sp. NPDC005480]|uniref:hypothetical protein n=1 Tax=Streptomyces sp. NPDC005480 TaxID=3154880 RepID=UPI0033A30630
MSHETAIPHAVPQAVVDPRTQAVERLASLTLSLADDLGQGVWPLGPLERMLAARLLLACAGDGQFTPVRVQEALLDGSVALTYVNEGRLARLLAKLLEVTTDPAPHADSALAATSRLLERAVRAASVDGTES